MKRLFIRERSIFDVSLIWFLIVSFALLPCSSYGAGKTMAVGPQLVASGTVAAANIAVTLTNGSADVELSSATIPRNYRGNLLKICDANNVCIQGFVYTNGAGTVQNIVSTKGGTTRNWASQGAGFDDTTNCTYQIYRINSLVEVSGFGGAVTAANEHASLVTGTAFYFSDALDFTPYQDGRHYLSLMDTAGVVAWGKIKAEVPGGLGLSEKIVNGSIETGNPPTGWNGVGGIPFLSASTDYAHDGTKSGKMVAPGNSQGMESTAWTSVTGELYKYSFWVYPITVTNLGRYRQKGDASGHYPTGAVAVTANQWNNVAGYFNESAGGANAKITIQSHDQPGTRYLDEVSFARVTIPPATGAIIVNAAGTQNWINYPSTFNANSIASLKVYFYGD